MNTQQLHWACRRGMLELDVLLGNFLKEAYSSLTPTDRLLFQELLTQPDPVIFEWLLGQKAPADPGLAKITELIRSHARSRI